MLHKFYYSFCSFLNTNLSFFSSSYIWGLIQVAGIESDIHGGKKVMENVILNLIELLMTQLIKLDSIDAEGDVKLQRRMQVKQDSIFLFS